MENNVAKDAGASAPDGTPSEKTPPKSGGRKGKKSKGKPESTPPPPAKGAEPAAAKGASTPKSAPPSIEQGNKPASAKKQKADKKGQGQGQEQGQGQGQGEGAAPAAPQKTKAELKAERRALQEAQRASKTAKKEGGPAAGPTAASQGKAEPPRVPAKVLGDDPSTQKKVEKKLAKQNLPQRPTLGKKVAFFSHLRQNDPQLKIVSDLQTWHYGEAGKVQGIHPQIKTIGLKFADFTLVGSSCRATALLSALSAVIQDYKTPKDKDLCRDLDAHIKPLITFVDQCRPLSISMGNAIKFLKWKISRIPPNMPEAEAKKELISSIDKFVRQKIVKAADAIAMFADQHITKGEYIIVFGFSFVVLRVLLKAKHRRTLTVLVVDNRPRHEGQDMLRRLRQAGMKCVFVAFNQAAYCIRGDLVTFTLIKETYNDRSRLLAALMPCSVRHLHVALCQFDPHSFVDNFHHLVNAVTGRLFRLLRHPAAYCIRGLTKPEGQRRCSVKVLLGAHGVLNNSFVMSRIGAAMLASTAKAYDIPVLVCHETYKISERSQTDSFVFNELGDPNEVIRLGRWDPIVPQWMDMRSLTALNLMYDVTANCFVSMFVTEIGSMSDTSIPKVLSTRTILYET
ncbi:hypothetical protein ACOMHN_039352 [Nucella lapillus]